MSIPAQEASCALQPVDEAPQNFSKSTNHKVTGLTSESNLRTSIWPLTFLGDPTRPPPKAPEDPLTPETKREVQAILIRNYYHEKIDEFRRELKNRWTTDQIFPVLDSLPPIPPFKTWQLRPLYHKAAFLYWPVLGQHSQLILACFHKEWFRHHDERLDIQADHFIASPVRITSNGPSTIPGILNAHKDLIDQAARDLSVEATSWLQSAKYILLSLSRAVILILDRPGPESEPESDGWVRLERESQRQNVLIIRTRDEDGLSKPIDFEDIRMHALPLAREDIPQADDGVFAIRVSISTAVKFITDLKHREEAAFFSSRKHSAADFAPGPNTRDQHFSMTSGICTAVKAEAWADALIKEAEMDGVNNVLEVKFAVIDIHKARRGEHVPDWQPYRLQHKWRTGSPRGAEEGRQWRRS